MQGKRIQLPSDNIRKIFGRLRTNSLARYYGAVSRKQRKFSTVDLLLGFWQLLSIGEFSYDKWALQISSITKQTVSGQAVWKRMNGQLVELLKALLQKSLSRKISTIIHSPVFEHFDNVYLQDATHFSLPKTLSSAFPGSYSHSGESATAKVQAILNLKKGSFVDFQLNSFRDNDQKDSIRIVNMLNPKDLVIRDLGYHTIESFQEIDKKGGYFLSRYKYGVNVYNPLNGEEVDIIKRLKKHGHIDMEVELGKKHRQRCRLIAIPVNENIVNQRRRRAKNDRNKKANHSKEYSFLLGYTIYITNVSNKIWPNYNYIETAYKCRWYIEILFKGWKSNLKIKLDLSRPYIDKQRAEFIYYASLLMVTTLVMPIFSCLQKKAITEFKYISILKVCTIVTQHINIIVQGIDINEFIRKFQYFTRYECRNDRNNALYNMSKTIT